MKANIFILTRTEQRVVILVLVAILSAAFVRYWHNVKSFPPRKPGESPATTARPLPLDGAQLEADDRAEDQDDNKHQTPSPQSSP